MKKLLFTALAAVVSMTAIGQNKKGSLDDIGRIAIAAYVPSTSEMNSSVARVLESKLRAAITRQGMSAVSLDNRFVITAAVNQISKDVTPTAPPMIAYNLDVDVFVADVMTQSIFGQVTFPVKGVGTNERKAYLAGIKGIKPTHADLQDMITDAKDKIIEYYNSKCDFILKEGESLAKQGKFEEAIAKFMTVPEVCKECYAKALDATEPVYLDMINKDCEMKLNQARNTWNAEQSYEAAFDAIKYIADVDPMSECFDDVQQFSIDLNDKVKELRDRDKDIEDREWNFTVQVHEDGIALEKYKTDSEMEQAMAEVDAQKEVALARIEGDKEIAKSNVELAKSNNELSAELAKARIDAYKEVGLAQAEGRSKSNMSSDNGSPAKTPAKQAPASNDKIDVSFIPGLEGTGEQ